MLRSLRPLVYGVTRDTPELIAPCKPTPREFKPLSDIDNQAAVHFQAPLVQFYPNLRNINIGKLLREAIGKVLVYYYPYAGRLREAANGPRVKLAVDCSGEGVMFVEAEANVTIEELRGEEGFLRPPFPCFKDLLFDVPGSSDVLHTPLLLIQVTRTKCGGFVLAVHMNHAMADGAGLLQFLNAIIEMTRGASMPSVMPVWKRELFCFQGPPRVISTRPQHEKSLISIFPVDSDDYDANNVSDGVIDHTFFFSSKELSIIRQRLHPRLRCCSTFELLAAFLWQCRTIALRIDSNEKVRLAFAVDLRSRFNPPIVPVGYYGNAMAFTAAYSPAGKITNNLDYAVELVQRAKAEVTLDYVRSGQGLWPEPAHFPFTAASSWLVSDVTRFHLMDVDFGCGKPGYIGMASAMVDDIRGPTSWFIRGVNGKGERGVLLPISLPPAAMDRFAKLLDLAGSEADPCLMHI